MPTTKGKGGSRSQRHRPASEYDNATLAQKREYWRTKKREQRARLSERRRNQTQDSRDKKLPHPNLPPVANSQLSGSFAAFSSPLQSNDESHKPANICPASRSGKTEGESSVEATESQREKWLEKTNLNKLLPQLPAASYCISAKAAVGVKCITRGAVSKALSSLTPSRTLLNTSSLVPPGRATRVIKGRFTNVTPQPMLGALVPKPQQNTQVSACSQPKLLPTSVTTGTILVSPASIKTEGNAANTTPHSGTKSALVILPRAKGANSSPHSLMSEEDQAAKRREHWRIKKREQRAKLAAQRAKARERTPGTEMTSQRQAAPKTRTMGDATLHSPPSQSCLRRVDQKQCPSVKRENDQLQSVTGLAPVDLQAGQIKGKIPHPAITCDMTSVKKVGESQRKLQHYAHLPGVSKGIGRCKTPRQRFNEAHKSFMNQRNLRCKSPLLFSIFGSRNIPKIDPNDTPEQIIAKRREYWRIKKREQRAKLSMEVKTRLKEKDSLMRRVKRYQTILGEMRRARTLTHASDTIGGFIKEDGTVTINIPTGQKREEELHVFSNNNHSRKLQHQPDTKQSSPAGVKQLPPPLCLPQVKVSLPPLGYSVNKPPTRLSDRPRTQSESTTAPHSHSPAIQTVGRLTLTHPHSTPHVVSEGSAASSARDCVSKGEPSVLSRDPASREEDRLAKKREYWRIKKREQRAARAVRLKQGVLQARANATLQRRKAQRHVAVTSAPPGTRLTNYTLNAQTLPNNTVAVMAQASEIKQESEFLPAAERDSPPQQAICPDIKPPTSLPPPPPPVPQPECDPALNADSQATTLLAVASMKKLLEESLSTVTECKSEQNNIEIESVEDTSETGMRPDVTPIVLGKDEVPPIAADRTLEIKSWQPDIDALVQEGSTSSHLKDEPQMSEFHPPLPTSSEAVLLPTCEQSSQTPSNLIINLMGPADGSSSPCRTQGLHAKAVGHPNCCSPEPPKLHHLPTDQLQQQHCEQQQHHNNSSPSATTFCSVVMERSGLTSLQRKREYWKLMKRQQRARLKARQTERRGDGRGRLTKKSIQAPGLIQTNTVKDIIHPEGPALKPKPSIGSLTAVTSIPTILVVSPTTCNAEESRDRLQVTLPVTRVYCSSGGEQNKMNVGLTQSESDCLAAPENQQEMPEQQKWMSRSSDVDSALKPPDNPLSSIDLQPIEPPGKTSNYPLRTMKVAWCQFQSPTLRAEPSTKLAPISTMVPPKPIPGESEEGFLKRKREYWRIKKKEQRARKAIRDKGGTSRRASNDWRPILPDHEMQTLDCGQWVSSSEEPEHLTITSLDSDLESFPCSYSAPIEDESELLDADYENGNGDEGPVSDTVWRSRYLMDYDPLNQLLVCMVCGELQYSHSLEGARAHIDEAHPDTLTMHLREKQRILEAWDEQVSQRERFFTSQLQQHSGALADAHRDGVN